MGEKKLSNTHKLRILNNNIQSLDWKKKKSIQKLMSAWVKHTMIKMHSASQSFAKGVHMMYMLVS